MARFKHTGARRKQLQSEGVKNATNVMIEQAERDLGRSLTASEIRDLNQQARDTFGDADVYRG